jgi:excisionase family DNA binding protein
MSTITMNMKDDAKTMIMNNETVGVGQSTCPNIQVSGYNIREAAVALRMSEKSVRRLISRGFLRKSKAFGHIRIPAKDVQSFLEKTSEVSFAV